AHLLQKMYHLDYLPSPLVDERFANTMVFLNLIWLGFPGNLIIWGGAFSRIPDSIIESARMDGVSWIREMFQIILPLVWPTFVLVIVTSLAGMFGATGNVFLLTGGGKYGTQTLSNWMYLRIQQSTVPERSPNLYRVSAMGLMLTVISCIIAFSVRRFMTSKIEETTY
ncbi:MAG: carbohydrate ABC transporter permease, partial [Candidatus Gallimonas sp.]